MPAATSVLFRFVMTFFLILSIGCVFAAERADHPRLWITMDDLPKLRNWANADNPIYQQGIRNIALQGAQLMDSGALDAGDNAGSTWTLHTSEDYAALFAFMSLIDPVLSARPGWATRGRTMLFRIIDSVDTCQRATPPVTTGRFCQLSFPVSDRSRWSGHSIPLAADWLQATVDINGNPTLSAADIAKLRRVFLIWSRLSMEAYPNPYNNPPEFTLPVGTIGEALLRLDVDQRRQRLRFSGNNYYAGHMRNMSMRALAIDRAADQPDALTPGSYLRINSSGQTVEVPLVSSNGALRLVLSDVLKGWLLVQDYLLRHDSRGGLPQEGLEYMPTSIGIPGQMLLALDTAGLTDLAGQTQWGQQVGALINNPFYARIPQAILQSLSPRRVDSTYGMVYKPAWYGDGEHYYFSDQIDILGPLALWADRHGDPASADIVRWAQRHLPPNGSNALIERVNARSNPGDVVSSIIYFLLFDPTRAASGPQAVDPRPTLPLWFWSEGLGRLVARTDWGSNASWFNFRLGFNAVDHQHGDGGMFELYRRGEWLTKGTIGYGNDGGATDYKNSLTIENTIAPGLSGSSFLGNRLLRGAQMPQGRSQTDPSVERRSVQPTYHYLRGNMTGLYNAYYTPSDPTPMPARALDVQEASRDLFWLNPDVVISYDRARGLSSNRRKRFWLNLPDNLPSMPTISGNRVTGHTPDGQWLHVSSVLPVARTLSIVTQDPIMDPSVNGYALGNQDNFIQTRARPGGGTEKYATRLMIEATGAPLDTRFLTVLEGGDAGFVGEPAELVQSAGFVGCATSAGSFEGVARANQAIWFARERSAQPTCLELPVPTRIQSQLVSGLSAHGGYSLTIVSDGSTERWRISQGGSWQADEAGVLLLTRAAPPMAAARISTDQLELGFGARYLGASQDLSVLLRNEGLAPSTGLLLQIVGSADFTVQNVCSASSVGLPVGGGCNVVIRFTPRQAGLHHARLDVHEAGQLRLQIALRGMGETEPAALFRDGFENSAQTLER